MLINEGLPTHQAARHLGISKQTYFRWRREYGGMPIEQARRITVQRNRPKRRQCAFSPACH